MVEGVYSGVEWNVELQMSTRLKSTWVKVHVPANSGKNGRGVIITVSVKKKPCICPRMPIRFDR